MREGTHSVPISVIIPCRGHAQELQNCLRGLTKQAVEFPYEIIVVDSAFDPAVAAAAKTFPQAILLRSPTALPPGEARNWGAERAQGRYLAFVDADCIPEPGWLAAAQKGLEEGAVMVGGPVLDALPMHPIAAPDNFLQFIDFSPGRKESPAPYFPGCNLAVTRAVFCELRGFPLQMPIGEDVTFSKAAASRWPGRLRFLPKMRVRHRGRTTWRSYWRHQEAFGYHRALLGHYVRPIHLQLGRWPLMGPAIVFRRLSYIVSRAAFHHPAALLRLLLFGPSLLFGLTAYARGFQRGCREAGRREK